MKTSIIIVNFKSAEILLKSIESLYKYEKSRNFEVIIVDNYSGDNSKEIISGISEKYDNIKTVFLDNRKSFSFANNRGFDVSECEYVLIQNPDIIYTEPILESLTGTLTADGKIGAISPMLIGADNKFQRNYFLRYPTLIQFILFYSIFGKLFYRFPVLMNKYLENQEIEMSSDKIVRVEQIPCAFFLTRKDVFIRAGKMDERYELFFEDVDLSYQVNKFKELVVNKTLSVKHLGGVTFKSDDNWWMYGRFIYSMYGFVKKNCPVMKARILKFLCLFNSRYIILNENIKGAFKRKNIYRFKKHKYLVELFIKSNG